MFGASLVDIQGMSNQTHHELDARLAELEEEERAVSMRRRRLHDRLALFPDYGTGASDLAETERELSKRRSELHDEIDAVRAQRAEP